jgi:hypothetical protein
MSVSEKAAIPDAERQLIQSLFDYGSATHPDPVLRATAWTREHAMLALANATAVAQRLFSAITGSPGGCSANARCGAGTLALHRR